MLKIVADENIAYAQHFFAAMGELLLLPGRSIGRADVKDADILLVRSVTQVNRELLEGSAVRFVGSCTIGTDHVDTQWLSENNIRSFFVKLIEFAIAYSIPDFNSHVVDAKIVLVLSLVSVCVFFIRLKGE